jgi:hypothetical protein
VPLHALLALQVSFALIDRGLPIASAMLLALLAPFAEGSGLLRRPWLIALPLLAAYLFSEALIGPILSVPSWLGQACSCIVLALAAGRAYQVGLRTWLHRLLTPPGESASSELDRERQGRHHGLTHE